MAAPAGMRTTMGLDPGMRTGVKVGVVDATGKLIATDTVYPHTGQAAKAAASVAALCSKHKVELVAIGNGTASRETERFYLDLQKQFSEVKAQKVIVSEAGASVVFCLRAGSAGIPPPRRVAARRGVHRPLSKRSAGGVGEDRPEIHRHWPLPTRFQPKPTGQETGLGS